MDIEPESMRGFDLDKFTDMELKEFAEINRDGSYESRDLIRFFAEKSYNDAIKKSGYYYDRNGRGYRHTQIPVKWTEAFIDMKIVNDKDLKNVFATFGSDGSDGSFMKTYTIEMIYSSDEFFIKALAAMFGITGDVNTLRRRISRILDFSDALVGNREIMGDEHFLGMNDDIMTLILLELDHESILSMCATNTTFTRYCEDKKFWSLKSRHDFGTTLESFTNEGVTNKGISPDGVERGPKERHLQLLSENGFISKGSERYISPQEALNIAVKFDDTELIDYFLELKPSGYRDAIEYAAEEGHIKIVRRFLNKWQSDPEYSDEYYSTIPQRKVVDTAIKMGQIRIVNWLLHQAYNVSEFDYLIQEARRYEHEDVAELIESKK